MFINRSLRDSISCFYSLFASAPRSDSGSCYFAYVKKVSLLFTALCFLAVSARSIAEDPPVFSKKDNIAVRGADVVAYFDLAPSQPSVKGNSKFSTKWNGATWYFSSENNLKKFTASPKSYAPQYGGYCAFAVSHGFTKSTDPDAWYIEDGKLYLNFSRRVQKKWLKDVPGNIVKADKNWPKVLD